MTFDFEKMKIPEEFRDRDELRFDLLEGVLHGDLSPDDAERRASELGVGRFSGYADAAGFPVMDEDVWTLDMALAWIRWRSSAKVVEYWPCYRKRCRGWEVFSRSKRPAFIKRKLDFSQSSTNAEAHLPATQPVISPHGYRLVEFPLHSIFSDIRAPRLLVLDESNAPQAEEKMDHAAAEKLLRSALVGSRLVASATDCETGKIVDIPAREWARIRYRNVEETELVIVPPDTLEDEDVDPSYRDVFVLRAAALELWPIVQPLTSHVDEKEYRRWLDELPKGQQMVGRFFWDVWKLDIKPINAEKRYDLVAAYAKHVLNGTAPSHRTIIRFFDEVRPWLKGHRS